MAQTEVYAPKSGQLLKTVLNWLAFLFQIFVQIVKGTPSMAQVFNSIGFSHGGQTSFLSPPSSSPGFKPLPVVEIPLHSSSATAVDIGVDDDAEVGDSVVSPSDKLTVCFCLILSFVV